jgi:hypothetical protein
LLIGKLIDEREGLEVPKFDLFVGSPIGHSVGSGVEAEGDYFLTSVSQCLDNLFLLNIPNYHVSIIRPRDDPLSIWTELSTVDCFRVAFESLETFLRFDIPHFDISVCRSSEHEV